MGARKTLKATRTSSAEKENRPPKQAKRTISVSDLFKTRHHKQRRSEKNSHDVFGTKAAGISKQTPPKSRSSVRLKESKRRSEHPLFRDFSRATRDYRQGVTVSRIGHLEPLYHNLVARVDGLTLPGELPHNPSLSKPIEDELATIQIANGKTLDVKLGDTMRAFEKMVEHTRPQLERSLEELRKCEVDIANAKEDVLSTERGDVAKARRELDVVLQNIAQEAFDAKEQTVAEIKQALKDEQAAAADEKRKVDEFMKSLS